MTSPNFSEYIDLTIYDLDAYQVYDDAITYARDAVPEFAPRAGTLEEAIMQAVSYQTALLSSQINRLPDGLMEGIARLSGLTRREATFSEGSVQFFVYDDNGVTIPQGTIVAYEAVSDDIALTYAYETTADLVIPVLSTIGTVNMRAIDSGVYPALLYGQPLQLISPAPSVVGAILVSQTSLGGDSETDAEFFNRASQHFASLSTSLTTKTQMANYLKSTYPFIGNVAVFDLTNSAYPEWSASPAPGYVTIVMCDINGNNIVPSTILDDLSEKVVAGLTIENLDQQPGTFTVDVAIVIAQGYDALETRNAVDEFLTRRLSILGYDFSGTIIKNELISQIANIQGVQYVSELTFTIISTDVMEINLDGNIVLTNKHTVPDATVTVTS